MGHFLGCRLSSHPHLRQQQIQLAGVSAKGRALYFFLISTNYLPVLGNIGVYLNTGAGVHNTPGMEVDKLGRLVLALR